MAEEKQEKKKARIVKRIFKWLSLALLVLLLITALIFQAPWKVITLLVAILLACTALPRPYRKWFWLSVGVVIIALIVWVFLPDETKEWRPYTFDEELAALKAKYAIPDSENAAIIYNELFETPILDGNEPEFLLQATPSSTSEPWLSKDHPETAQWLQQHNVTMEKLLQASKIEKCAFRIDADPMLSLLMDRLPAMRQSAYLLVSSANNDIAEGRLDAGLEKYLSVINMGNHQCQQPSALDILVGMAIEMLAISQFKSFVVTGDATEQHLSVIEEALGVIKYDWSTDFARFIEHEKLFAKNFWGMFYEINPEGKIRFSRDPYAKMRPRLKEQLEANQIEDQEAMELLKSHMYPTYWRKKLIKAGTILGWFGMPSTPRKAGKIIDAAYERYYAMAKPDFDWQREPEKSKGFSLTSAKFNFRFMTEVLVPIMEPAYYRIHDTYLRLYAGRRGSQIIIALRRFKNKASRWPESLDDVKDLIPAEISIDPINGGSFVYKLTDDNFTLYSKGKNNIDENGQSSSRWDPNTLQSIAEQDDVLIWPRRRCDTQEQDNDAE